MLVGWPKPSLSVTHVERALKRARQIGALPDESRGNYAVHYNALAKWFNAQRGRWTAETVVLGCLAVYGWMPTILEVKKTRDQTLSFDRAKEIADALNTDCEHVDPAFANGSVVGTSKFLHFAFPDRYPIWDSRVRRALVGKCADTNPVEEYRQYRIALTDYSRQQGREMRDVEQELFWLDWHETR